LVIIFEAHRCGAFTADVEVEVGVDAVCQAAACAYLAQSGPKRGLSDGMMLTQNQFH